MGLTLTEYAAAQLFIRAVKFLSRFQNIKHINVNAVYHIQLSKIKDFKKTNTL